MFDLPRRLRVVTGFGSACLLLGVATIAQAQEAAVGPTNPARYFRDASAPSDRNAARARGLSMYGPTIPVDPQAQTVEARQYSSEIPFRLVNGNLVVVSVRAGSNRTQDFILDTGADTTIVDSRLAARMRMASLRPVEQTTLAGVSLLRRRLAPELEMGAASVQGMPVLVENLAGLRQLDARIEGILGQDFLSHFNYLLDYRRHVLRIEAGSEIENALAGDRVAMETNGNRMIVAADGMGLRRTTLRLLLDSGANSLVLMRHGAETLEVPAFESVLEVTTSGSLPQRAGQLRALAVGGERFHDVAAVMSGADPAEPVGDGLLPTMFFGALYVNNREGFVVLNPRARKK